MTKAQFIEKYGEDAYEQHKERCKKYRKERYASNPELYKKSTDAYNRNHADVRRKYKRDHRIIGRINNRDWFRAKSLGLLRDGYEIHHMKYHANKKDDTWLDDIVFLTKEEHIKWHLEHPEFNAMDNVIYA